MFGFVKIIKQKDALEQELALYKYKNRKIQERLDEQTALALHYEYLYNNEMQKRFELLKLLSDYDMVRIGDTEDDRIDGGIK